jgi:hypothetical protein
MSARFGANATSYLSRTTDLPGATPLTVCWRTQLVTDRNAAGMLWTLINSGLNTYEDVRLLTDGTTPRLGTNAANTSASSGLTVGTWYHMAYVRDGSAHTLYLDGVSVATLTSSISLTPAYLIIGTNGSIYIDERMADFGVWTVAR